MRLEGTGLVARWGRDLTGDCLFRDKSATYVRQVSENFQTVLTHQCGYYALNKYLSGQRRNVTVRVIYLPLANRLDRRPRIVGYSVELERRSENEGLLDKRATLEAEWLDIGAGFPRHSPNRPVG